MAYNEKYGITPKTIIKPIKNTLEITKKVKDNKRNKISKSEAIAEIDRLENLMKIASADLDFEVAIKFRDEIKFLKDKFKIK